MHDCELVFNKLKRVFHCKKEQFHAYYTTYNYKPVICIPRVSLAFCKEDCKITVTISLSSV